MGFFQLAASCMGDSVRRSPEMRPRPPASASCADRGYGVRAGAL